MQEQIWLRSLPAVGFEICCIPFRVYGITLGDVVELDSDGKRIIDVRVKGGHRAFRVFFSPTPSSSELEIVRDRIHEIANSDDLLVEWSGDRHVAVDVSPTHDIERLWQEIQPEVRNGSALWEWGDAEPFRT